MLPARHRLTRRADFREVTRSGVRGAGSTVVVYLVAGSAVAADQLPPARAGLIVSKAVGGSVIRHRVSRRLRSALAGLVPSLGSGSRVVVRALPAAGGATGAQLADELRSALAQAQRRSARERSVRDGLGRDGLGRDGLGRESC